MTMTLGKKLPGGVECLYELLIQSVAPCWCSSQKAACGGGVGAGARRGQQYPFGPNRLRGILDKKEQKHSTLNIMCIKTNIKIILLSHRITDNIKP